MAAAGRAGKRTWHNFGRLGGSRGRTSTREVSGILLYLKNHGPRTSREIARTIGYSPKFTRRVLQRLRSWESWRSISSPAGGAKTFKIDFIEGLFKSRFRSRRELGKLKVNKRWSEDRIENALTAN